MSYWTYQCNFSVSLNQQHFASVLVCVLYLLRNTSIAFQCIHPFLTVVALLVMLVLCSNQFLPYDLDQTKTVRIILLPIRNHHRWTRTEPTGTAYLLPIGEHVACLQGSGHYNRFVLISSPLKFILDMYYNGWVGALLALCQYLAPCSHLICWASHANAVFESNSSNWFCFVLP